MQQTKAHSFSFSWILVFFIIYIKSIFLLVSIYSFNIRIILNYSIISVMPIILLLSFSFILSDRKTLIYLLTINFIISLLFIIDIVYARAFGKLISFHMFFSKNVLSDMNKSIYSIIKWTDFLFIVDIPFSIILFSKLNYVKIKRKLFFFIITLFSSISIIGLHFINLENSRALCNYKLHPLIMSPIGNHMFDLYRVFYEKNVALSNNEMVLINEWFYKNTNSNYPDGEYEFIKGIAKGKNIIAIQFESLENIVINNLYYDKEITPNINKLLNNSIYFNNIFEQTKEGNSSDAELMFNTSLYPISNGSTFLRFANNKYLSLPSILKTYGYKSVAIHGDDKEFWNRAQVFRSFEFDEYIDEDKFQYNAIEGMGIADDSLFMQSFNEIENLNNPYYMFIISLTSHMPFSISKDIKYLEMPYDDYSCNYLQSIHYTDKVFGEFYNRLKSNGYLENSILIIYGDHQGVHKYYDTYLPDNEGKVPFIIHIPGIDGLVIDKIGGQIDMMPTLLYLLGIEDSNVNYMMGKNLFSNNPGSVILPNAEIIGQPHDKEHLSSAQNIADLIIKGNYFKLK